MAVANEVQLKVSDLNMAFGGVQALMEVSFEVKKGEIFSIIGPNGAGKTVLLNCINGLYHPQKGQVYFRRERDHQDRDPTQGQELGSHGPFRRLNSSRGQPSSTISGWAATSISRQD